MLTALNSGLCRVGEIELVPEEDPDGAWLTLTLMLDEMDPRPTLRLIRPVRPAPAPMSAGLTVSLWKRNLGRARRSATPGAPASSLPPARA